ncbi:MAG: transcription termination factor Rho [Akkermansia sp.]|nr:transcription termination factor Rho [Akkermansia sp.]
MSAPDERTGSPRPRVFRKSFTRHPADNRETREGSREPHARPHRQQQGHQLRRPGRPQRDPAKLQQERAEARRNNIAKYREVARREKNAQAPSRAYVPVGDPEPLTGILEITPKGFGFIRTADNNWAPSETAIYVPEDIITTHRLRPYVQVSGMAQRYERGHQLISVSAVNGLPPEQAAAAPHFEDLKAVNPTHRLAFETSSSRFTTRTLDLMAPVARGQRGLIVAPPRTGKTTLLMHIAEGAIKNYGEELHLMVLLVDERPEEVTEFKRQLPEAEIFASSNDSPVREHCRMAEMCIERAKRLVENGKHVLILMDSITRLARAYNNAERGSGRTMSGGIDARALETPRRLFAAARNTRAAGSLTILATALVETNSRMDELIFQEFKGTGNMELVLNRRIAEMYIYPAVDILKSGTRREELILPEMMLEKVRLIRRGLANYKPTDAMERLLFFLRRCPSNAQLIMDIKSRSSN